MSTIQKICKILLPGSTFNKLETESQKWYFKCDCGNEFNIWEIGGIRYKANGNPTRLVKCTKCNKIATRKLLKR